MALDAYLAGPERSHDLIGYTGHNISCNLPSLAQLLLPNDEIVEGPVRHSNIRIAEDRDLPCVHTGSSSFEMPAIADMQTEYFEALHDGYRLKAKWIRLRCTYTLLESVFLQLPISLAGKIYAAWSGLR